MNEDLRKIHRIEQENLPSLNRIQGQNAFLLDFRSLFFNEIRFRYNDNAWIVWGGSKSCQFDELNGILIIFERKT